MQKAVLSLSLLAALATSCFDALSNPTPEEVETSGRVVASAKTAPAVLPALAAARPTSRPRDEEDDSAEPASSWGVDDRPPPAFDPLSDQKLPPELADEPAPGPSPPVASSQLLDGIFDGLNRAIADGSGDRLVSTAKETWIYAEPTRRSRRIGYLRAGATVRRSGEPTVTKSCKVGFYKIEPAGYVCADRAASLDLGNMVARASARRPRMDGLPYDYVIARLPGPPFYTRIPSASEQSRVETDLGYHLRQARALERDSSFVPLPVAEPTPDFLSPTVPLPGLGDAPTRGTGLVLGRARARAGFALLAQFDAAGRRFGLTPDLLVIPLDRTRLVKQSTFHGLALNGDVTLPVAFVIHHHAHRYDDDNGRLKSGDELDYRDAVPLTGKERDGGAWLEAKDGTWVKSEDVRRIDPPHRMPAWAEKDRRWIDVSILKQSLVAYQGSQPVYVTLVSTGADGLGDPKKTHSTIQGVFLIHTKHVSVTMDNDDAGDAFDLRDVPFVQYFTEGYALHAAYWHDDFGTPRSHGCVNLAPIDAAWLFGFTTPNVPAGWHASLSLHQGTLVYTHP